MNSIKNNTYDYVPNKFYDYTSVSSHIVSTYREPEWKSVVVKEVQQKELFPLLFADLNDLINTNVVVRF